MPREVAWLGLLTVQLVLFAQLFIAANFLGLNLLSAEEWFPSVQSFLTLVCFYLPDLLLFLSGLHLRNPKARLSCLLLLYYLALIIFLAVKNLRLEDKPVWYLFQEMSCDWVSEALMMGGGCPWLGFYPRTEILGIVLSLALTGLSSCSYLLGVACTALALVASLVLMLVQEQAIPHDLASLHNPALYESYSRTSSHIFFYALGVTLAMAKQNMERMDPVARSPVLRLVGLVVFGGGCALVGLVPWIWRHGQGF